MVEMMILVVILGGGGEIKGDGRMRRCRVELEW